MKKNIALYSKQREIIDLKTEFLLEALNEVQETNRFLDAKAGVLVSIETTLLFVVVAMIFDSEKFIAIEHTLKSMPLWNSLLVLLFCAIYLTFLVAHIVYTVKVLNPLKNPEKFVQIDGYKPKGLFFLGKNKTNGKIHPSMKEYVKQLSTLKDSEILNELVFELMKMSYIRDTKSERVENSLSLLKYLI
ncbi:MAG: hypothetical protein IH588_03590, partial [Anaerolineales bacterium]|nr:hypothetical protein [Anaerolineales bacterium]